MIDLQLNLRHSLLKFDAQLPVYNWYYPFVGADDVLTEPQKALEQAGKGDVKRRALYVHMPFCDTICTFCPFYRSGYLHRPDQVEHYLEALYKEIAMKAHFPGVKTARTDIIAVGGGTPSILTADQILRFGEVLHRTFDLSALREFTFEVEVKSVTPEKIRAMKEIGVNRISFGSQTFSERYRRLFNLTAPVDQIRRVTAWLTEAFPYTNTDIIYGMAGQSLDDLLEDAEAALSLGTTTVDFYTLNNMSASVKLHRACEEEGLKRLSAATKVSYRMYLDEYLRARGYVPINGYSYTKLTAPLPERPVIVHEPVFEYHDLVYGYGDEEVLGFGVSAFSQIAGYNLYNPPNRESYIKSLLSDGELPVLAYGEMDCPEKGIVYFPYRGTLDKTRIDWDRVPADTKRAFEQAVRAGLIDDREDVCYLTPSGWLNYVNLIYHLMPEHGRRWLSDRIDQRLNEGREEDLIHL